MEKTLCGECKHYLGRVKCKAFPEIIPSRIFSGENNHDSVQVDQKGKFIFQRGDNPINSQGNPL